MGERINFRSWFSRFIGCFFSRQNLYRINKFVLSGSKHDIYDDAKAKNIELYPKWEICSNIKIQINSLHVVRRIMIENCDIQLLYNAIGFGMIEYLAT